MDIIFYAGSLRPGGGLTVAQIMIEALAEDKSNSIVVYTGAKDTSKALASTIQANNNVQEKQFFQSINSELRYLISKFYFLPKSFFYRKTLLISINYYIPVFCRQLVYHLNLLSFLRQKGDSFSKKIKEFDASLACRFATLNIFESDFLRKTAEEYTGININNPKRLYIGIDPAFYFSNKTNIKYIHNTNILLVSSPQPHKDNQTCIDTLKILSDHYGEKKWKLTIVGGQSTKQWLELKKYVKSQGVADKVDFLGPINKIKLSKLMHQSLCLISASKVESFCMVALEAMASECPAIVTDETSMPESVGKAAIIVKSGSSEEFAQSILDIYNISDYRKKLLIEGVAHASNFSVDSFAKNLKDIITNNI